jgi:hypothetical protein
LYTFYIVVKRQKTGGFYKTDRPALHFHEVPQPEQLPVMMKKAEWEPAQFAQEFTQTMAMKDKAPAAAPG